MEAATMSLMSSHPPSGIAASIPFEGKLLRSHTCGVYLSSRVLRSQRAGSTREISPRWLRARRSFSYTHAERLLSVRAAIAFDSLPKRDELEQQQQQQEGQQGKGAALAYMESKPCVYGVRVPPPSEENWHSETGRDKRSTEVGGGVETEVLAAHVAPGACDPETPCCVWFDYGFKANFLSSGATIPGNIFHLAIQNFSRELHALRRNYVEVDFTRKAERGPLGSAIADFGRAAVLRLRELDARLTDAAILPPVKPVVLGGGKEADDLRRRLNDLTLNDKAVWAKEEARSPLKGPWWIRLPYYLLCSSIDAIYGGRPIARFWFLETVARVPYFSYITMLHLYESLGWWRAGAEVRKVHFAEEWNELHHLQIMESLGGDMQWIDRFMAQHAAIFYYWTLNIFFCVSPKQAYTLSELIELHATDTYAQFVEENETLLKLLPPSPAAIEYYESIDMYLFDDFQTARPPQSRRPMLGSLYDVFCAIRDDEKEHVQTMAACQNENARILSPHTRITSDASSFSPWTPPRGPS